MPCVRSRTLTAAIGKATTSLRCPHSVHGGTCAPGLTDFGGDDDDGCGLDGGAYTTLQSRHRNLKPGAHNQYGHVCTALTHSRETRRRLLCNLGHGLWRKESIDDHLTVVLVGYDLACKNFFHCAASIVEFKISVTEFTCGAARGVRGRGVF